MPSKRLARLNEQLKRELSELIRTEVRDPRIGMVSITGVETAGDLGSARVFVRSLGSQEDQEECLAGLAAAAPFLRRALGQILHIRRIPELRFQEDRSMEHARRIETILAEVLPDDDPGEAAADAVGDPADDEARADGGKERDARQPPEGSGP